MPLRSHWRAEVVQDLLDAPMTGCKPPQDPGLIWPEFVHGTLVRRYKRFLAEVQLDDGRLVTAHCPNSGSMLGCSEAGRPVYLSRQANPKRKLPFTWELIDMGASLVGVNTLVPNRLVKGAIADGSVPSLQGYGRITPEIRIPDTHTRLDLLLKSANGGQCFVEIKNCTLVEAGTAAFPDAVTTRGRKHLQQLRALRRAGHRAVIFFLIQRMDARRFAPAAHIDPDYAAELQAVIADGVEILVYDTCITLQGIGIRGTVPWTTFF